MTNQTCSLRGEFALVPFASSKRKGVSLFSLAEGIPSLLSPTTAHRERSPNSTTHMKPEIERFRDADNRIGRAQSPPLPEARRPVR
jgi:hypothetical protein